MESFRSAIEQSAQKTLKSDAIFKFGSQLLTDLLKKSESLGCVGIPDSMNYIAESIGGTRVHR